MTFVHCKMFYVNDSVLDYNTDYNYKIRFLSTELFPIWLWKNCLWTIQLLKYCLNIVRTNRLITMSAPNVMSSNAILGTSLPMVNSRCYWYWWEEITYHNTSISECTYWNPYTYNMNSIIIVLLIIIVSFTWDYFLVSCGGPFSIFEFVGYVHSVSTGHRFADRLRTRGQIHPIRGFHCTLHSTRYWINWLAFGIAIFPALLTSDFQPWMKPSNGCLCQSPKVLSILRIVSGLLCASQLVKRSLKMNSSPLRVSRNYL